MLGFLDLVADRTCPSLFHTREQKNGLLEQSATAFRTRWSGCSTRWSGCAIAWSAAASASASVRRPAATAPSTNTAWKPCGGWRKSRPNSAISSTACATPRTRKSSTVHGAAPSASDAALSREPTASAAGVSPQRLTATDRHLKPWAYVPPYDAGAAVRPPVCDQAGGRFAVVVSEHVGKSMTTCMGFCDFSPCSAAGLAVPALLPGLPAKRARSDPGLSALHFRRNLLGNRLLTMISVWLGAKRRADSPRFDMLAGEAGCGFGGPPMRHRQGSRAGAYRRAGSRGCGTGSHLLPEGLGQLALRGYRS